jgi:hypothetical protein
MWTSVRADHRHASILDPKLLASAGEFLQGSIEFGLQSDARVDTVGRPTARVSRRKLGQRDDV